MPYRLRHDYVLDEWIATGPDLATKTKVLAWLFELTADPFGVGAQQVPLGVGGLPNWVATVPYTSVQVVFSVAKSSTYAADVAGIYLRSIS